MMKRVYYNEFIIIIILAAILIAACSATSRYQILSTVFDGVSDPNEKEKFPLEPYIIDTTSNNVAVSEINKTPEFIYHPPYRNRMCAGCHDMQKGNALIKEIPDLCYKCHENITEENPAIHGPVAMGECKTCHSPHLAKNKFLLVRKGRDLCLHCHEATYVYENKNHFAMEEYDCLNCHNPHSGKDRFLLN